MLRINEEGECMRDELERRCWTVMKWERRVVLGKGGRDVECQRELGVVVAERESVRGVQFPPNVTRGLKKGKDETRAYIESKRQGGN